MKWGPWGAGPLVYTGLLGVTLPVQGLGNPGNERQGYGQECGVCMALHPHREPQGRCGAWMGTGRAEHPKEVQEEDGPGEAGEHRRAQERPENTEQPRRSLRTQKSPGEA